MNGSVGWSCTSPCEGVWRMSRVVVRNISVNFDILGSDVYKLVVVYLCEPADDDDTHGSALLLMPQNICC
jgi:hypothetical protein